MKKLKETIETIKDIPKIKSYKEEIAEQDKQYEELLCEYGKLETLIEEKQKEIDKEIDLKNRYLESCRKLRLKVNELKEGLKNEIKTSKATSTTNTRTKPRGKKR